MNEAQSETLLSRSIRGSRDALLLRSFDEPDLSWRVLVTLNAFRLLIAVILLGLFFASGAPRVFGDAYPVLFAATASGYLVFAALSAVILRQRWGNIEAVGLAQLLVDILAIVILMHASGGISSGLGGLLVVFVGAGSLILPFQYPAILAAIATFAILGEQAFAHFSGLDTTANFPAAGILGAIIFAMALAAQPLARRIQASEALARKFGIDLQNVSELNEYIVQHLRESIVVVDADDTVRLINSSAIQLLGAADPLPGSPLRSASPELDNYVKQWREKTTATSHPEFTLITEGNNVRITAHMAPLGKDGQRAGPILIFLEDVSIMNARVQQSKLASLGRLSASIAHEIRNPVGAMSHAAQLLRESQGLEDDDKRLTDIIRTHSDRVSLIIDNVLQLSRRESSRPLRLTLKTWLNDFATEFVRTLELQEGEFTIKDVPDDIEVRMDPSHLRQVLWNLCDNAVKYASETGGIMVEVQAGRLPNQGRPFLEVLDCGLGVDEATAEKIFEPFFTARSGGTGLGLYISRELCELNRATLLYLDRPGGGSIFRIVFADPDRWERQDDK
ncbi:MAG: PAS domain-containing protein [Gammaproteobacteria bacterium]|nr:PAS domain-containing protein [Gammaproteobacteria bacterium]NNC56627.1 PAS domain-containing protein [Woeseiaceae bacterium]NNL51363.1 PAS domain-containing protein [Woeseiaceae bacterium]